MTFNSGYPTSADPVVAATLQGNFAAIENGTVNHKQLTLAKKDAAPSGVTDKMLIYGLEDTQTEAYAKGADGTAVQLTQDGKMGSTSTNVHFDTLSYDGTNTFNENNFIRAWGHFERKTSNGAMTLTSGVGLTGTRTADGTYKITFTNPLTDGAYGVSLSLMSTQTNVHICTAQTLTGASFFVKIRNVNNSAADDGFYVHVIGGTVAP